MLLYNSGQIGFLKINFPGWELYTQKNMYSILKEQNWYGNVLMWLEILLVQFDTLCWRRLELHWEVCCQNGFACLVLYTIWDHTCSTDWSGSALVWFYFVLVCNGIALFRLFLSLYWTSLVLRVNRFILVLPCFRWFCLRCLNNKLAWF